MSTLEAHPLHPTVGAEVSGLEISRPLEDEEIRLPRDVFDRYGLVVFRGVELNRHRQTYLCELLRTSHVPTEEEAAALSDQQGGFWISNTMEGAAAPFGSLMFHADSMWSEFPFEVLSLFGVDVHAPVSPTLFASATAAWDALPKDLKDELEELTALNVSGSEYMPSRRVEKFVGRLSQGSREKQPSFRWPVVRTHLRTGQTLLFVCQANTHSIGLDPEESEDLIERLFEHLYAPENVLAHEWHNGDLVIWDNWAIHHGRPDVDRGGPARTVRKIGLPLVLTDVAPSVIDDYKLVETDA